jgi:hypothetical protein
VVNKSRAERKVGSRRERMAAVPEEGRIRLAELLAWKEGGEAKQGRLVWWPTGSAAISGRRSRVRDELVGVAARDRSMGQVNLNPIKLKEGKDGGSGNKLKSTASHRYHS